MAGVPGFASKNHPERIRLFGWYLHAVRGQERFTASDVIKCYEEVHLARPANMSRFLISLVEKRSPDLLRDPKGYRLARPARDQLDNAFGKAEVVIAVEALLTDLPGKLADEGERLFLTEVLTCYRHGALRAAIVMTWNLAYDHLTRWILDDPQRLADFNAGIPKRNPRKGHIVVSTRNDFEDLKEDEVVDIVGALPRFSANVKRLLKEKLGRRNTYAHPSTLTVMRPQVDEMITDLVNNVVLHLPVKQS